MFFVWKPEAPAPSDAPQSREGKGRASRAGRGSRARVIFSRVEIKLFHVQKPTSSEIG